MSDYWEKTGVFRKLECILAPHRAYKYYLKLPNLIKKITPPTEQENLVCGIIIYDEISIYYGRGGEFLRQGIDECVDWVTA
jgi:hypothetical protein